MLPALDALGGAAALGVMGGGILLEQTSEDGEPEHFTLYYAGPLLAVAIVYFASATFGTNRVSRCTELRESAVRVRDAVRPIEGVPPPPAPGSEPASSPIVAPDIEMEPEKLDVVEEAPEPKPKPKQKKPRKKKR